MNRNVLAATAIFILLSTQTGSLPAGAISPKPGVWAGRFQAPEDKKWAVWNRGTYLRGANIWVKRDGRELYPTYKPSDLADLAKWGANYVNISYPGIYNEEPHRRAPRYATEKRALDGLRDLVAWAGANNLHVVIAFRTGPQSLEKRFATSNPPPEKLWSNPEAQNEWVNMWREAAREFRGEAAVVGYDLMVEPDTGGRPDFWRDLAKRIIVAVRDVDKVTPILIEPADWGGTDALTALDPQSFDPKGDLRLVYAAHQYAPTDYSQQTEGRWEYDCGPRLKDKKGEPKPGDYVGYTAARAEELKGVYARLGKWKAAKKVPVVINEFGVIRWAGEWGGSAPIPDANRFMDEQLQLIEGLGMNYAVWKWDPAECMGDDDFNFRHGQLFKNHTDVDSTLSGVIRSHWKGDAAPR